MGRTSDDEGESSTEVCKSDSPDERPLKKARYIWQIKGKYHVKKTGEENSNPFIPEKSVTDDFASAVCSAEVRSCNTLCCKQSPCKSGSSALNAVKEQFIHTNANDAIKISSDHVMESCQLLLDNTSFQERSEHAKQRVLNMSSRLDSSLSTVPGFSQRCSKASRHTRVLNSRQLRKWQARQEARCFVDNTINKVLEGMGFVPLPFDGIADNILDEEYPIVENETENENEESVEDEAVRMAIHSHGLQRSEEVNTATNPTPVTSNVVNASDDSRSLQENVDLPVCSCMQRIPVLHESNQNLDSFHKSGGMWHRLEFRESSDDSVSSMDFDYINHPRPIDKEFSKEWTKFNERSGGINTSDDSTGSCDTCSENTNVSSSDNFFEEDISEVKEPMDVSLALPSSPALDIADKASEEIVVMVDAMPSDLQMPKKTEEKSSSSFEHDFMDAAVAVAIQKKGLSALSCVEYG